MRCSGPSPALMSYSPTTTWYVRDLLPGKGVALSGIRPGPGTLPCTQTLCSAPQIPSLHLSMHHVCTQITSLPSEPPPCTHPALHVIPVPTLHFHPIQALLPCIWQPLPAPRTPSLHPPAPFPLPCTPPCTHPSPHSEALLHPTAIPVSNAYFRTPTRISAHRIPSMQLSASFPASRTPPAPPCTPPASLLYPGPSVNLLHAPVHAR